MASHITIRPFFRLALRQAIGTLARRTFYVLCAAVAINGAAAYLLGFESLQQFGGL